MSRKGVVMMLSGVILAGNVRWSGLAASHEMALVKTHVSRMRKVCSEVVISTNEPRPFLETFGKQVRIVTDYYQGKGALGGMYTGLALAVNPYIWIVDAELPAVSTRAASLLYEEALRGDWDAVMPASSDHVQPYHAIYKKECANKARNILQAGGKEVHAFLESLNFGVISNESLISKGRIRTEVVQKIMNVPALNK